MQAPELVHERPNTKSNQIEIVCHSARAVGSSNLV